MHYPEDWKSYELLDAGNGRKLERFGKLIVNRPEPSADFKPKLSQEEWDKARFFFTEKKYQNGNWSIEILEFEIPYSAMGEEFRFKLKQTAFKHLGIFPEQAVNWKFIAKKCQELTAKGIQPKVLNLFAYTGAASLIADRFGAKVTHIDSSKSVVNWAKENAEINGISTIRWIVEDARKFVGKSVRRGERYHGIIMDPPIFGMVPKGKSWKLNRDLPELLENSIRILDPKDRFFILNTYSPQLSLPALKEILHRTPGFPDEFEATTLGIKSSSGKKIELGNLIRFKSQL